MDITQKLAAPFPVSAISWRVGSTTREKDKGMALAYIDARDAQDRLNEVCGPFGWQCRHEVSSDKRVTCHVGVRNPETGEWVWKSDGAGETDYEGEKGSYSDSFKRACVKWGIGRYLYEMDSPWVAIEARGSSYTIPPASIRALNEKLAKSQAAYFGTAEGKSVAKPAENVTRISPNDGVWDGITDERKAQIADIASVAQEYLDADDIAGARDYLARSGLEGANEQTAVMTFFQSYEKAAMKQHRAGDEAGATEHLIRNRSKRKAA